MKPETAKKAEKILEKSVKAIVPCGIIGSFVGIGIMSLNPALLGFGIDVGYVCDVVGKTMAASSFSALAAVGLVSSFVETVWAARERNR